MRIKEDSMDFLFEKLWNTPKDKFTWNEILAEAKNMRNPERVHEFDKGYDAGYERALDCVEWKIQNELRVNNTQDKK